MRVISSRSANEALFHGCHHLNMFGVRSESRNGPVVVSRSPVMTLHHNPANRVLVCAARDANPFFHLFESLWMLAGRNDLKFPQTFVKSFDKFSDDGVTLHGAYGHRWREWFGYDQLEWLADALRTDPTTRRAVLTMWDGWADLSVASHGGVDVPCNTHAYFDTLDGKLNMTVLCRSNDMILGAYGANIVHFSMLLEYMSAATGIPMGIFRQFSNNFHAYTQLYTKISDGSDETLAALGNAALTAEPYGQQGALRSLSFDAPRILPLPLIQADEHVESFYDDCVSFVDDFTENSFETLFFRWVVAPMYESWKAWKDGDFDGAVHKALQVRGDDWRAAAQDWLAVRARVRAVKGEVA